MVALISDRLKRCTVVTFRDPFLTRILRAKSPFRSGYRPGSERTQRALRALRARSAGCTADAAGAEGAEGAEYAVSLDPFMCRRRSLRSSTTRATPRSARRARGFGDPTELRRDSRLSVVEEHPGCRSSRPAPHHELIR